MRVNTINHLKLFKSSGSRRLSVCDVVGLTEYGVDGKSVNTCANYKLE